ncbi:MAG: DUF177 domain-containing protein [Bacteriovoracia bacterium]
MKVFLREIRDVDTELAFTQDVAWVLEAVARADESSELPGVGDAADLRPADRSGAPYKLRPIDSHFTLRKIEDIYQVEGRATTSLNLLCSRCAKGYTHPCQTDFSAYYSRNPKVADAELGKDDLEINFLSEDFIDLKEVLAEQIQLQVPFQPLCKESCKGMCHHCGTDLNAGRCACEKLVQNNPFSVLKDLVKRVN